VSTGARDQKSAAWDYVACVSAHLIRALLGTRTGTANMANPAPATNSVRTRRKGLEDRAEAHLPVRDDDAFGVRDQANVAAEVPQQDDAGA
jgi:hypothetical protein